MIGPSIQARHALARLTLPVMVVAAFGLMLVGKVDTVLVEHARIGVYDASAPIYAALAEPLAQMNKAVAEVVGIRIMPVSSSCCEGLTIPRPKRWLVASQRMLLASCTRLPDPSPKVIPPGVSPVICAPRWVCTTGAFSTSNSSIADCTAVAVMLPAGVFVTCDAL